MKQYTLSVMCLALGGLAWAADPAPPVVVAPALPAPCGPVAPQECAPPCVHKVCVPEPTVKKTDTVIYDDRCVDYCLPKCSLSSIFSGHGCSCGDSGCLNCGHPRTRRVLIKKYVHEECPDTKCVVQEQPPCATADAPLSPPAK